MHYTCNYKCSYCFLTGKWEKAALENRYPGTAKWLAIWEKIYDKYGSCHIHFSGGEPSVYPDFFTLIGALAKKNTLELSTNLSFEVKPFIEAMEGHKAEVLASFHPEFADWGIFFEKILELKRNNFSVSVCYVAYPPLLGEMEKIKAECDANMISFIVQPFRGIFRGRTYPESYTQKEVEIIRTYASSFSINEILLDYHLNKGSKHNVLCRMGQMYAKIYACADVYRCEAIEGTKIGNLLEDQDFKLLDEAAPCEKFPCSYCDGWRAMIVGEEEKWMDKWR